MCPEFLFNTINDIFLAIDISASVPVKIGGSGGDEIGQPRVEIANWPFSRMIIGHRDANTGLYEET